MKFWLGWCKNRTSQYSQGESQEFEPLEVVPQKNCYSSASLLSSAFTFFVSMSCLFSSSACAAERLTFQAGLFQQSIEVDALDDFAKTGKVPSALKTYKFLLTPNIKQALSKRLYIDPLLVEPLLADLFSSPDGEKLLEQLSQALPGSDAQQIKDTLSFALHQGDALNILSFVRAYPNKTLSVDLGEVAKIAMQLNASSWQNQLIGPRLERDLKVETHEKVSLSIDPTATGNETVSMVTLKLRDRERQRSIPADIYYSRHTRGPLVVISHGFGADRKFMRYLAHHLASHGLTVVALDHPGSNITALVEAAMEDVKLDRLLPASEFIDRPQDVSFLLDRLEKLNQSQGFWQGKFNTQQVTVIGHSFGSYTALALAGAELNPKAVRSFCSAVNPLERSPADWLQCAAAELPYGKRQFRDPRVAQVIAFNPIIGHLFGDDLATVKVPTLVVSSAEDGITPTMAHQLRPFQQLSGEKYLLVAMGATHMSVTDIGNLNSTVGQSTLVKEVMGEDAKTMRKLAMGISLAFVEQLTNKASTYEAFLSPAYVQSLSDEKIAFRWAKELPPTVDAWLNVLSLGNHQAVEDDPEKKPSVLRALKGYFIDAQELLSPGSSTAQLDRLFNGLLYNYDSDRHYWDSLA